ncbi:putative SapC family protein [Octadecabacter antarcticus 307]|uniref:Putative SapC family protein n=1 Tax=Octadecabacter antarcticus 307 TaxID=391626 RepID=M9RD88_9RHOB|nr:SapC family protein [Octadecabacter antarcticus]AGI69723.1 putative SapC family protein [Octadecabacter antarcticus 307]
MAKQNIIYGRAVPVNTQAHKDVSVEITDTYAFAKHVNTVPIVAAEFTASSADLVIVFTGSEGAIFPSVLLGVESDQNEFIDEDGLWTGKYVPAFLRRYPFVFAQSPEEDQLVLCIDEEFEGVNSDGVGERLFDSDGERTQYLENKLQFSAQYQNQHLQTKIFCARLLELGLLEPAVANFMGDASQPRRLSGFFRINREKLKAIAPETLTMMFNNDELELCYVHLQSFNNVDMLGLKSAASSD